MVSITVTLNKKKKFGTMCTNSLTACNCHGLIFLLLADSFHKRRREKKGSKAATVIFLVPIVRMALWKVK